MIQQAKTEIVSSQNGDKHEKWQFPHWRMEKGWHAPIYGDWNVCLAKMTIHEILQYPLFSQQIHSTTTPSRFMMIKDDKRASVSPIIRNTRHHFWSRPKWINLEHSFWDCGGLNRQCAPRQCWKRTSGDAASSRGGCGEKHQVKLLANPASQLQHWQAKPGCSRALCAPRAPETTSTDIDEVHGKAPQKEKKTLRSSQRCSDHSPALPLKFGSPINFYD